MLRGQSSEGLRKTKRGRRGGGMERGRETRAERKEGERRGEGVKDIG
jgi:hypothetical protein